MSPLHEPCFWSHAISRLAYTFFQQKATLFFCMRGKMCLFIQERICLKFLNRRRGAQWGLLIVQGMLYTLVDLKAPFIHFEPTIQNGTWFYRRNGITLLLRRVVKQWHMFFPRSSLIGAFSQFFTHMFLWRTLLKLTAYQRWLYLELFLLA